jgi:hypothetical protein
VQVAEENNAATQRAYKIQKGLYENAPGVVEKMHVKWAMDNAQLMAENAKDKKDALHGSLSVPFRELLDAVDRVCLERNGHDKMRRADTAEDSNAETAEPYVYQEPLVQLPRGLLASPFTDSDTKGNTAGASLQGVKIAPNLHQADVPTNSRNSVEAKKQEPKHINKKVEKVLEITLPIDSQTLGDKVEFKKELVDVLAKTAHISSEDLTISDIKDRIVPQVQFSAEQALSTSQRGSTVKRKFLRASPV